MSQEKRLPEERWRRVDALRSFRAGMGIFFNTRAISKNVMFTGRNTANKHWFIFTALNKKLEQVHADMKYMQICSHANV